MYLSDKERYSIELLLSEKWPVSQIAKKLGRNRSTIYKEIKKGTVQLIDSELRPYMKYCADVAIRKTVENSAAKGAPLKIGNDYEFANYVEYMIIKEKYSPDAVLMHIKNTGKSFKTTICCRTLYSYIDKGIFLNLTNKDLLVKRCNKKSSVTRCAARRNILKRSIEERPVDILKRRDFGHWEMDTVCSKQGVTASLLVLSERMTRQEIIISLKDKTTVSVVSAINDLEKQYGKLFPHIFKTITVDNGVEFSDSDGIENSIFKGKKRTVLYYCHAYSSCERGTNENINKMIRRFIPKGSDIGKYTKEEISQIERYINNYPRRILNGLSSNQSLEKVFPQLVPLGSRA